MSINKIRSTRRRRAGLLLTLPLLLGGISSQAFAACEYTVSNSWNGGFVASIRVTNDTAAAVNNWSVNWGYTGNNRVSSAWNATLSGTHPYTATALGWNSALAPGQSVEFGLSGTGTGPVEIPRINGALCGPSPPVSSTSSSRAPSSSVASSATSSAGNTSSMTLRIEENGPGFCRVDGTIDSNHAGFTGTGFANGNNQVGAGAEWSINVATAGSYRLQFRHANGGASARPADVLVNGVRVSGTNLPTTGNWGTWETHAITLNLSAGVNRIRLAAAGNEGLSNIDALSVTGARFTLENCADAQIDEPVSKMRRPLSPSEPMFMIHADSWNAADPQKIIDLIPEDLRPYTVLIVSMSILHDENSNARECVWRQVENGHEVARSWVKTAAENGVWVMVQPSSGGFTHFADFGPNADLENTIYGELFRDYPNFLGINYAEQFWGFDTACSGSAAQRWEHWANLLKLTNKYGGYLAMSFTGGFWGAGINPLAMIKRNSIFDNALKTYPENFIIQEKYTMQYGFHDIESLSLGLFLSGYSGHYGSRTDRTGWKNVDGTSDDPVGAGSQHLLEHMALTGQTVFDGPELIWLDTIRNMSNITTSDGYQMRRWELFPHFKNIQMDIYRKVLDGSLRLLDRKEVIDRTKIIMFNDMQTGNDRDKYATPENLYKGLYLMDDDGTYMNQNSWYKKTGRYPAIPMAWRLNDQMANDFDVVVNRTAMNSRWPTQQAKVNEFNQLFPQEYTGDIYAGRHENTWITYNPYKVNKAASGRLPLKYNSCEAVEVNYPRFTSGMINEKAASLDFYLTNYEGPTAALKNTVIKITGASRTPTYSFRDRGEHTPSRISENWNAGVYTLTVAHNGPLDLTVNCQGSASNRLSNARASNIKAIAPPPAYTGPRQYEAEHFDFKSIGGQTHYGINGSIRNYQGLGYLNFGNNAQASVRDEVNVPTAGTYQLRMRYSLASGNVNNVGIYVNGALVATPVLANTGSLSNWMYHNQSINLRAGKNTIEYRSRGTRTSPLYFDNFLIVK